jgi:co-chaperonin GroES (HSP10)
MENKSGLKPLGHAVLVEKYEPERKGGLIEIPDTVQGRMTMVDQRVLVIEVGPAAWEDESSPRAKAGDRVLVTGYAGALAKGPLDGKTYRLVNDRDIFCAITGE